MVLWLKEGELLVVDRDLARLDPVGRWLLIHHFLVEAVHLAGHQLALAPFCHDGCNCRVELLVCLFEVGVNLGPSHLLGFLREILGHRIEHLALGAHTRGLGLAPGLARLLLHFERDLGEGLGGDPRLPFVNYLVLNCQRRQEALVADHGGFLSFH